MSVTKPEVHNIATTPEDDRATSVGNMHKNGKDRSCGSGDILSDRQTQTYSSQYFVTTPAGEVNMFIGLRSLGLAREHSISIKQLHNKLLNTNDRFQIILCLKF